MSSTPQFNIAQLQSARTTAWHQSGEPLLTLDGVREWIASEGLILFAPRPQHLPSPAPSLVEATLGTSNDAPTAAQTDTARSFVARLVSEGNALPLNLLGGPGDVPDFVVSAQVFSFVFTLRGDKLWKQAPANSASVKVTPLALGAYELLAEKGAMTAAELANELGRELTEAAVLRALNELWIQLRVLPLLQQGDAPTLWELTSKRFTKAIKAGVNAGQPTALSALVSLYLSQALLASEDEIATFLSPLAARSRIKEVIHGLSAGRQLEPVVLEGKALLHIPGTLPVFPEIEPEAEAAEGAEAEAVDAAAPAEEGRIKRFTGSGERSPRDFKGKPASGFERRDRKPFGDRTAGGDRPARPARPYGERTDRERRPFQRDAASAAPGAGAGFTRPWDEDRKPRAEGPASDDGEAPAKRSYSRPSAGGFAKREGFSSRPAAGDRRPSSDRGPARKSFGDKPPFRKDRGEGFTPRPRPTGDGERKPFVRRDDSAAGSEARPRRSFDRPAGGGFAAKRPYVRRDGEGGDRPARPAYGGSNSKPREVAPKRTYTRRDNDSAGRPPREGAKRPYVRRDDSAGDRPAFGAKRPYTPRGEGGGDRPARPSFGAKRPYTPRSEGSSDRPARPSFGAKRPYTPRAEGSGDRPARPSFGAKRPYTPRGEGNGDRAARPSFGAKRPYVRREGAEGERPARPFRSGPSDGARPRPFAPRGDRPSGPPRGRPAGGSFGRSAGPRSGGKVPFGGKPGFSKRPAGAGDGPRPRKPKPEE